MMMAWACAVASSTLVDGALPALVLTAAVAPVWISIYRTLTNVEDLLAPVVVPLVGRWRPGRTLLVCESATAVLLAGVAAALALGAPEGTSIIIFLILASPIPLILDVADELYGSELADISPEGAFDFTSHLHSLSALITRVLAVPLGAALTLVDPLWLVLMSLTLTAGAIWGRVRGVVWEERAVHAAAAHEGAAHTDSQVPAQEGARAADESPDSPQAPHGDATARAGAGDGGKSGRTRRVPPSSVWRDVLVSPLSIAMWALAAGLMGSYVFIYVGHEAGHRSYLAILIATGVGGVLGPQLARILRPRMGSAAAVIGGAFLTAAGGTLTLLASSWAHAVLVLCLFLFVESLVSDGLVSTLIAERQVRLSGSAFITTTTWCHAAGAAGGLAGNWLALALGAEHDPRLTVVVAVISYALLGGYAGWAARVERRA